MPSSNTNSKSSQVRALLKTGMAVKDIAARVGCTPGLVSVVKWGMKRAGKRVAPQPTKTTAAKLDGLAAIVDMVKNAEFERARLRSALEKVQAIVADALA